MRSEALKKAQAAYQKRLKRIDVRFNPATESALYEKLTRKAQEAGLAPSSYLKGLLHEVAD